MTTKTRRILEAMSREELQELAAAHEVQVRDRRVRGELVDALAGSRKVDLLGYLGRLARDRLKAICRALELDDSGKEKAGIVARLLGQEPATATGGVKPAGQTALELEPKPEPPPPSVKAKRAAKATQPSKSSGTGDLGFERTLFQAADKLRNNMDAGEYKHVVLGLVFLKYISDAFEELHARLVAQVADGADPEDRDEYRAERVFWVPKAARWSGIQAKAKQAGIGQIIDDAMAAIERDNPSLRGVLLKNYGRPGLDKQRLGELVDLIGTIGLGSQEQRSKDILGRVYEYFLSEFALAEGRKGGQFYTPRSVVRLLVEMLAPYKGRVYDPCCGSGGMFVQSERFVEEHGGRHGDVSVYGQESNETTWRLAKMNLAIRGIEANLGPQHADTFHRDLHPDLKADYILANPPFNAKDWGGERLVEDVRWKYGAPAAGTANFAWVQHFIHHLAPTGQAGFVLANGSMSSNQSGEGEIRKTIIEADLVDCMVALPGQLFYSTQIAACLWFLARDKKNNRFRDRRGHVLFIDARKLGRMLDRTQRDLTELDIARISEVYHAWRGDKGSGRYEDIIGFCKSATLPDIRSHQFVLTPGRYVGTEDLENEEDPFEDRFPQLTRKLVEHFKESNRLQDVIVSKLNEVGYE
jgi:type I restriction enzyme M protein